MGTGNISVNAGGHLSFAGAGCSQPLQLGAGGTLSGGNSNIYSGTVTVGTGISATIGGGNNASIGDAANDLTGGSGSTLTFDGFNGPMKLPFSNDYQGSWVIDTGVLSIGHA